MEPVELDELPVAYATALRMEQSRLSPHSIAEALAIEPEAVASLLELAHAKLARVRTDRADR